LTKASTRTPEARDRFSVGRAIAHPQRYLGVSCLIHSNGCSHMVPFTVPCVKTSCLSVSFPTGSLHPQTTDTETVRMAELDHAVVDTYEDFFEDGTCSHCLQPSEASEDMGPVHAKSPIHTSAGLVLLVQRPPW
jgi:hypothetical protein